MSCLELRAWFRPDEGPCPPWAHFGRAKHPFGGLRAQPRVFGRLPCILHWPTACCRPMGGWCNAPPTAAAQVLGPPAAPTPHQAAGASFMPAARGAQAPLSQQHVASLQQVATLQQVCAFVAWPVLQIWQPAQAARLHQTEALAVALCVVQCDGAEVYVLLSSACCQMPASPLIQRQPT